MKKICFLLISLLISVTGMYADNDRITHDINELPEISRKFLTTYYSDIPISHIKIEKNMLWIENYDVILTNGTCIEFTRSGEWKEVKGHPEHIPAAIIPSFIQTYINQHYPGAQITCIDKDSRDYEVDLTNGFELKFDLKGNLLDIDR